MATQSAGPFNVLMLYSKATHNIVYCEVDSSFVDYWCSLFRQPLGSIMKRMQIVNDNEMRTSAFTSVYESMRALPQDYFSDSKASFLERTAKSKKDKQVAKSSRGPVFVKDNFKFIISDQFQFFEQGASKSIEIIHAEKVHDMSDLDSKLISIDEVLMLRMVGRVLQNHTSVLNDVLGKYVKSDFEKSEKHERSEKSEKKEKKSHSTSSSESRSSERSRSSEHEEKEKKHHRSGEGEGHGHRSGGERDSLKMTEQMILEPQLSEQYSKLGKQYTKLGDQYNQLSEQAKVSELQVLQEEQEQEEQRRVEEKRHREEEKEKERENEKEKEKEKEKERESENRGVQYIPIMEKPIVVEHRFVDDPNRVGMVDPSMPSSRLVDPSLVAPSSRLVDPSISSGRPVDPSITPSSREPSHLSEVSGGISSRYPSSHMEPSITPSSRIDPLITRDPSISPSSHLGEPLDPSGRFGEPNITNRLSEDPSVMASSRMSHDPSVTRRLSEEPTVSTTSQLHPFII